MAPSNRKNHLDEDQLKDDLFGNVKMFSQVPAAYVSLKEAERENGVCLMDFKKFGVPLDGSSVMRGKRNGHMGIYLEPGYLQDVRNYKTADKISADYLSEKHLVRCLERKNCFEKGWVKGYRETDPDSTSANPKGWAIWGQKEGQRGPATWYYPKSFVKHKAKMEVLPTGSLNMAEVQCAGCVLKQNSSPVFGIRPDFPSGPDYCYQPADMKSIFTIIKEGGGLSSWCLPCSTLINILPKE